MAKVTVKACPSPTCMFLAFDWEDGARHADFLGFAIQRDPGFGADKKPQFLFNKLDFVAIAEGAKPKGSDLAPLQKFNWWDSGFNTQDRGKTFKYTVFPFRGTGPGDLNLQRQEAGSISVALPRILDGKIASYFNRAVVSSQSFLSIRAKDLATQMKWLANGLGLAELRKIQRQRLNHLLFEGCRHEVGGGHQLPGQELEHLYAQTRCHRQADA